MHMKPEEATDYQAALDAFRRDEQMPDNPVRSAGTSYAPPMKGGIVDYKAVVKAWDKDQAGKYTIYTGEYEDEGKL